MFVSFLFVTRFLFVVYLLLFLFIVRLKYAGDNFVRTSGVIKDFAKTQSKFVVM